MAAYKLSSRYAKSLLDLAKEKGKVDAVENDMLYLAKSMKASEDLRQLLKSPIVHHDKKISVLAAVFKSNIDSLTWSFIELLVKKGREKNLYGIAKAFDEQFDELKNITKVKLTTAHPLSKELLSEIQTTVSADKGVGSIELQHQIDESLIGGYKLNFNNKAYDASLSKKIKEYRDALYDDSYIAKI